MKYKLLFLLIFFIPLRSFAADSLGRLFFTPAQRAQLDVARAKRDQRMPVVMEQPAQDTAAAAPPPGIVTYGGAVRRSDGKSTVWLNGKPVTERNRMRNDSEVSVLGMRRDGALSVAVPQAQRTASLKVGQSLDVTSGHIEEPYARSVRPSPPAAAAPADTTATATPPSTSASAAAPEPKPRRPSARRNDVLDTDAERAPPAAEAAARK